MSKIEAFQFNPSTISLGNNYLLVGGDPYLTDMVSDMIRHKLRDKYQIDLIIMYGDEAKAAQINDLLDTLSIFSSSKLILFRNADLMGKKEMECLSNYFDAPSEQQTVVITAEKIDTKLSAWKHIRDNCMVVTCDPPRYGKAMSSWLNKELARQGKSMSPKTKDLFLERIELDYADAANKLQKLVLLTGANKQISELDVMNSIGSSRAGTQVDFFRSLGNRDTRKCIELLNRMLASEWEPLQVLSLVTRFYNVVYRVLILMQNRVSIAEIKARYLKYVYQSQEQTYINAASSYRFEDMVSVFEALLETDARLKSSAGSPEVILTMGVLAMLEKS